MHMNNGGRLLAVVTGASSGIGFELAKCAAERGYDLIVAADKPMKDSVATLTAMGAQVDAVEADLATEDGVNALYSAIARRPVDALLANAGHGLGHAFLDQDWQDIRHVIDTNVTGTLLLVHKVARDMRARGQGQILITGSIAGLMPGTYQAAYNGSKAFLDSFAFALRAELKDTGVTVTCLMPGATETDFFERADMLDTKVGAGKKQPASEVARSGFEAMLKGEAEVVTGWNNKLKAAISRIVPSSMMAEQHRKEAAPGTAHKS
jgi:short-subunit dehydrogenase